MILLLVLGTVLSYLVIDFPFSWGPSLMWYREKQIEVACFLFPLTMLPFLIGLQHPYRIHCHGVDRYGHLLVYHHPYWYAGDHVTCNARY